MKVTKQMTKDEFNNGIVDLFEHMKSILTKKWDDYAGDTDPLANFRNSAQGSGITTIQSIHNQLLIKVNRLNNLLGSNNVPKCESIEDTILDLIGYASILYQAMEEERIDKLTEKALNHKH